MVLNFGVADTNTFLTAFLKSVMMLGKNASNFH